MVKVLLVEDDEASSSTLLYVLSQIVPIYRTRAVRSINAALRELEQFKPNIIVLDYLLSGENGMDLLPFLHDQKVLLVSACKFAQSEAVRLSIPFLSKPFSLQDLCLSIDNLAKT